MKRMTVILLTLVFSLMALTGCEPTVDGTSTESFKESSLEVLDSVDEDERPRLSMYMYGMIAQSVVEAEFDPQMSHEERSNHVRRTMRMRLDGMTADEIIDEAEAMDRVWGDPEEYIEAELEAIDSFGDDG